MPLTSTEKSEIRLKRFNNMKSVIKKMSVFFADLEERDILPKDVSDTFLDSLELDEKEVLSFAVH